MKATSRERRSSFAALLPDPVPPGRLSDEPAPGPTPVARVRSLARRSAATAAEAVDIAPANRDTPADVAGMAGSVLRSNAGRRQQLPWKPQDQRQGLRAALALRSPLRYEWCQPMPVHVPRVVALKRLSSLAVQVLGDLAVGLHATGVEFVPVSGLKGFEVGPDRRAEGGAPWLDAIAHRETRGPSACPSSLTDAVWGRRSPTSPAWPRPFRTSHRCDPWPTRSPSRSVRTHPRRQRVA